jgi:disulfide bond formation protein DsbB
MMSVTSPGSRPHLFPAIVLTILMLAVILSALALEHVWGYVPCELCLWERWPYYIGIPLAVLAVLSSAMSLPVALTRGLLGLLAVVLIVGAGLSIYHAGVEWKFWEGPSSCTSSIDSVAKNTKDLLSDLSTQHGPSCSDAALRVLGLSLSGWNVVASLLFAAIALRGARKG